MSCLDCYALFFFFNDTATTEIYTLSLHDALPISLREAIRLQPDFAGAHTTLATVLRQLGDAEGAAAESRAGMEIAKRSEEHTSELQSLAYLVCRLLLEKKKMTFFLYDEPVGQPLY